ncbi:DEAD/DEAH box helicase family protein [Paenibacillus polysaccharolyticus]|uniref:DEAD/DEAH box helicase family protein n=1 Tax=Paenibacillus polysaccharolyticus TaxID=582692 RepID=UPI0020A12F1A|nr:DEAD/DEAH box helicase family protein [Paenibacillus polysaccharolyticus]MCP1135778.1 DEAD/DEAH box helicase family protein [Paenibacillus polysaccharolyticus]
MSTKLNVKLITDNLADELITRMQHASGIYIMTSFIMQSGVKLLAPHLKRAAERGAEVRMLAGDYLYITQPEGLRALCEVDSRIEARLWRSMGTSFHPKAYLFDHEHGEGMLIVGSSNFSFTALKTGYEWNLAMNAEAEPYTFQSALEKFMQSFYHETTLPVNPDSIAQYEEEYRQYHQKNPEMFQRIMEMEEAEFGTRLSEDETEQESAVLSLLPIQPRFAQLDALEALNATMEEQYEKAMVVMATGLGKTYLAGFFAQRFQRILFIAHREEILNQAKKSFQQIMPERSHGIINGKHKDGETDCVYASIYTLSLQRHRDVFAADAFDLIVVDEFHHAAAKTYMKVIEYFRPQFLLGITATPDRLDGKDVYALCDGNVAYQMHFIEAIRRGWLAPFQYYGVFDDTDYSKIRLIGTKYDEEQLRSVQLQEEHVETIYAAWMRHKQTRTIGFCSSIRQADYLAAYFRSQGVKVLSLHSRTSEMSREEAIRRLGAGELEVVLTVDLFNEGTDIPSVDTLLFVRPTESLTVFTQQVGRGLRLSEGKSHCVIIDLIGNYRNADVKLSLFDGRGDEERGGKALDVAIPEIPYNCGIHLETRVVNLLQELSRKRMPRREKLHQDFLAVKRELGSIPTYLELHLMGQSKSIGYRSEFGSYVGFLYWAELLSPAEGEIYVRHEAWLRDVEKTLMNKSYKMVVLLYMLERGEVHWMEPITPGEMAEFFHTYLTEKEYRKRKDFSDKGKVALTEWNEKTESEIKNLIIDMPMSKWSGAKGSMTWFEGGVFSLNVEVQNSEERAVLYRWTREICLYRLHAYFERG